MTVCASCMSCQDVVGAVPGVMFPSADDITKITPPTPLSTAIHTTKSGLILYSCIRMCKASARPQNRADDWSLSDEFDSEGLARVPPRTSTGASASSDAELSQLRKNCGFHGLFPRQNQA